MTSKRRELQEDTHFRVLRPLQKSPETSQRELAETVGISVDEIHYLLITLIQSGLFKLANFTSTAQKRRCAYVLTPKEHAVKAALGRRFLAQEWPDTKR